MVRNLSPPKQRATARAWGFLGRVRWIWRTKSGGSRALLAVALAFSGGALFNSLPSTKRHVDDLSGYYQLQREIDSSRPAPHLAVVLSFSPTQVDQLSENLETWKKFNPCGKGRPKIKRPATTLALYCGHAGFEGRNALLRLAHEFSNCFSDIHFVHHPHLSIDASDRLYSVLNGTALPPDVTHSLILDPDTRPVQSGWLDQLLWMVQSSEPFWVKGSSFRAPCMISKVNHANALYNCHQLGDRADEMYPSALYNLGDPDFRHFVDDMREAALDSLGPSEPFESAWTAYLSKPSKEHLRRQVLKNFAYTDFIQYLGPSESTFDDVSFEVKNPWTFLVQQVPVTKVGEVLEDADSHRHELDAVKSIDPRLLRVLTRRANAQNNVMIVFGTKNYLEVVENFLYYVRKAQINCFVLIAMDAETVNFAKDNRVPHYAFLDSEVTSLGGSDEYTSEGFKRIVNKRSALISTTLRAGFNVLQSDIDVVWLKNPFPFFFVGDYEYEIQSDARVGFKEPDPAAPFDQFVNSGLFYARGTPRMADFYDLLIASVAKHSEFREQHLLNSVLQENVLRIRYRIMDPLLFPNGFQYFSRDISNRANVEPFAIHNNWLDGGAIKKYRFREINKWALDSKDYLCRNCRKYITFYEPALKDNSWNNIRNSLRSAIAIAKILDRTLILPKFYSHYKNPAQVTLDYYLDYTKFSAAVPNFRESSFTDRVFPEEPSTIFHISTGSPKIGPLPDDIDITTFIPKGGLNGATDAEIEAWFAPYADEPLLRLSSSFRRFHKFVNAKDELNFQNLIKEALTPASSIVSSAGLIGAQMNTISKQESGVAKWNCAHLPAQLWSGSSDEDEEEEGSSTLESVVETLAELLPTKEPVYVTSDVSDQTAFQEIVKDRFPNAHFYYAGFSRPTMSYLHDPELGSSMRLGAIEQWACAWGAEFVGDAPSLFASHTCYLRKARGKTAQSCKDIKGRKVTTEWY